MLTAIIGSGKVGTAVGTLLQRRGYKIVGVFSRTLTSAEKAAKILNSIVCETPGQASLKAELVLITTTDEAIPSITERIAAEGGFKRGQTVVHMSGFLTSDVLAPAAKMGAATLSLHPLQSIASVEDGIEVLPGSIFSVEGSAQAYPVAEKIVEDLQGELFLIEKSAKPLYHAAACVASNYLVSLVALSVNLMKKAGLPPEFNEFAILPLINGTLFNIASLGIPGALTGPISRGDKKTIGMQLEVMKERSPESLKAYCTMGLQTVDLALKKGTINERQAEEFKNILQV